MSLISSKKIPEGTGKKKPPTSTELIAANLLRDLVNNEALTVEDIRRARKSKLPNEIKVIFEFLEIQSRLGRQRNKLANIRESLQEAEAENQAWLEMGEQIPAALDSQISHTKLMQELRHTLLTVTDTVGLVEELKKMKLDHIKRFIKQWKYKKRLQANAVLKSHPDFERLNNLQRKELEGIIHKSGDLPTPLDDVLGGFLKEVKIKVDKEEVQELAQAIEKEDQADLEEIEEILQEIDKEKKTQINDNLNEIEASAETLEADTEHARRAKQKKEAVRRRIQEIRREQGKENQAPPPIPGGPRGP